MGCSSCETWLDRYVDGDLEPRRAALVARHLEQCPSCEQLHRRLRVVDALLETVQPLELRGDFGSVVMSAVRELPLPAGPRRTWPFLAIGYLVVAWLALAGVLFDFRARAGIFGSAMHAVERAIAALAPVSHSVSPVTPWAISAVVLVVTIDVLLFALIALYYRRLAPRLAVHLATAEAR